MFYRDGNVSRLGKLINKGFKTNYTKEDINYINSNCISPNRFLKSISEYKDSYER